MAIITPEEWQEIDEKIQYGLTHYGDNISKLLQTYKSIKTVLIDHGFDPDGKLLSTGILEYPIYISKSFIQLEDKIRELNGTIIKYEGNFSDIADAIISRGVDVTEDDPYEIYPAKILAIGSGQTTITGLGAFNSNGYLAGDVVIPEGVTDMKRGVIYYPDLVKTLKLPQTLTSLGEECFYCNGKGLQDVSLIKLPKFCTYISQYTFRYFGKNTSGCQLDIEALNSFNIGSYCFYESAISLLNFTSSKTDGFKLILNGYAFQNGTKNLSIQVPINTILELYGHVFSENKTLKINLENISEIHILASYALQKCLLTNSQVETILTKIKNSSIYPALFYGNTAITKINFNYSNLWTMMFAECSNLKTINIDTTKLTTFISNGIDLPNVTVNFLNIDQVNDNSIEYGSIIDNVTTNSTTISYRNNHFSLRSSINSKPIMRSLLYYYRQYITWKVNENMNNTEYYSNRDYGRGYGLWTNSIAFPSADEVYIIMKKFKKNSNFFGILNNLKSIEHLKLPYSSFEFWGGRDPTGTLTGHFKTITFDTSGYDPTRDCESTGPFPLGFGFNNLEKLIWLKTEPGCIIRSHTLGVPYTTYKPDYNNTYTEKCLQKLKEVYIGDGATVLESYIFSAMLTESTSYDQYVYTYNSNYSVMPFDYPELTTLYLPGTITAVNDNSLVVNGSDNFYLHPLYCGIGNTNYLQKFNQILLGSGWSLSIELTSLCFRDSSNKPYYNLVLTPEAMIFNINNLKDCSGDVTKQLIVTNKTLYDLRIYCNQYQGQEKTILKDTQCEKLQLIPTYDNLIRLANNKNWEIVQVAHSTWTASLTDNADNLIIDSNTNSITT